ncbi:PQQ-dependent sugar dehydrogenase [bacterium]|nr:PQQ-dependent sugar dehydrogenase [bacterium]
MLKKLLLFFSLFLLVIFASAFWYFKTAGDRRANKLEEIPVEDRGVETVATNLTIPWEIAFLPNGDMLVTERPGNLLKIRKDRTVTKISEVVHIGEGGLLGMALHPDFEKNSYIYLYMTVQPDGTLINQVNRYELKGDKLVNRDIILNNLPASKNHDGGRIKFGPDGKLYITVGDAEERERAQEINFLGGKILRVNDSGSVPSDNPFPNSPVYSYGHRNPQGLAWDNQGRLWSTEHGRSGITSGFDELNLIEAGKNYGWPIIEGSQTQEGMESPTLHSTANITWAPSGLAFVDGNLYFPGLRGETLYKTEVAPISLEEKFSRVYGRLRGVTVGPDGFLYFMTSNQDGRGSPSQSDDMILKVDPKEL